MEGSGKEAEGGRAAALVLRLSLDSETICLVELGGDWGQSQADVSYRCFGPTYHVVLTSSVVPSPGLENQFNHMLEIEESAYPNFPILQKGKT